MKSAEIIIIQKIRMQHAVEVKMRANEAIQPIAVPDQTFQKK